jgi:hypothetical protein
MTAPAEKSHAGEKHSGGLAQVVRWLTEERPITGPDDAGFVPGAPRRATGWKYGAPPPPPPKPDIEPDLLAEVRIGPAPRCAVAGETIALSVSLVNARGGIYLGWPIKLEWSSSDSSIATVNEYGIVEVLARGRVEITCTCEGKSGSVLLTVVEPAVAVAVGLPVPARLRPAPAAPRPKWSRPKRPSAPIGSPAREPSATPADESAPIATELAAETTATTPEAVATARVSAPEAMPESPVDTANVGPVVEPASATSEQPELPLVARSPASSLSASSMGSEPPTGSPQPTRAARPAPPSRAASGRTTPVLPAPASVIPARSHTIAVAADLPAQPPPIYRRSVERGSVKHGPLRSLALSRGTRRFLFRVAVGAATGAVIAILLSRSPEEVFVVDADPAGAQADAAGPTAVRRTSVARTGARAGITLPASVTASPLAPSTPALADTSKSAPLTGTANRVVSEAAGSAALAAASDDRASAPSSVSAPAAPAPTPTVTRVVVASSPSQLTEGETVRLSAAGVDDRGAAVSDAAVTWKSENEDVAIVDPDGVVTARRPGTVTIVATSDGRTGRVTLSVGARRAAEAPPVAGENGAAAAAQVIRARIDEFVTALRERNSSRLAAMYNAESAQDRKNLQALLERLRRPEARLKATDPALGALEVREMEAGVDFQVAMSWTTSFGRVRSQTSAFRAVLEPGDGGWRLVSIRSLGKID